MKQIKCRRKDHSDGCYTCGGYGYIAEWIEVCNSCKTKAWIRPGCFTCYDGKAFETIDGLKLIYAFNKGKMTLRCAEGCVR